MALVAMVEGVLKDKYEGVQYDLRLTCPGCRAAGRSSADAPADGGACSWLLDEPPELERSAATELAAEHDAARTILRRERVTLLQRACERWPAEAPTEATALLCELCDGAMEVRPSRAARALIAARESPLAAFSAEAQPQQLMPAPARLPAPPSALSAIPPPKRKFTAFLSHNWGPDECDRDNHARVERVGAELVRRGLSVWLDANEMRGDVNKRMADGIEDSACVVVFVTRRYLEKANGDGPNGADDNVKFEFDHALRRRGVARMVSVVMEPSCRDPKGRVGVVGGKLGGLLYVDLSADDERWGEGIEQLEENIRDVTEGERVEAAPGAPAVATMAETQKDAGQAATTAAAAVGDSTRPADAPAAATESGSQGSGQGAAGSPRGLHPRASSKKLLVALASDVQEERALKREATPHDEPASAEVRAQALGLDRLFRQAGVSLSPKIREAALKFCDDQQVQSLAELVEYESVDAFMSALRLEKHPEKKLRKRLEEAYLVSAPLHVRMWQWVKGAAQAVNEVPGSASLFGAVAGGGSS